MCGELRSTVLETRTVYGQLGQCTVPHGLEPPRWPSATRPNEKSHTAKVCSMSRRKASSESLNRDHQLKILLQQQSTSATTAGVLQGLFPRSRRSAHVHDHRQHIKARLVSSLYTSKSKQGRARRIIDAHPQTMHREQSSPNTSFAGRSRACIACHAPQLRGQPLHQTRYGHVRCLIQ